MIYRVIYVRQHRHPCAAVVCNGAKPKIILQSTDSFEASAYDIDYTVNRIFIIEIYKIVVRMQLFNRQ